MSEQRAPGTRPERGVRKSRTGVVVSDAMDKTIIVEIATSTRHRLYGKIVRRTTRLAVHDEAGEAKVGDRVRIMETRPLSKTKRWRLAGVLERAR